MNMPKMKYMRGDIVRIVSKVPEGIESTPAIEKHLGTIHEVEFKEYPSYIMKSHFCFTEDLIEGYAIFKKSNLRTGDIVLHRNGEVSIVNIELNALTPKEGWDDLDNLDENLTSTIDAKYDIVAVRRPRYARDCSFDAFEDMSGELVYDREKAIAMTIEDVSQLLGQKIKIVKRKKVTE